MKSYIINLYNAYERRKSVVAEFQRHQIAYELFYGVNNNVLKVAKAGTRISSGAVGAFLSHTLVLQNALNQPDELVLVVEDDVELGENFSERLKESLSLAPANWDILFLGWLKAKNGKEIVGTRKNKWIQVKNSLGVYAYMVKKSSIPKILSELRSIDDHIDKQLVAAIDRGRINAYWRREKLVAFKDFPSQIEK